MGEVGKWVRKGIRILKFSCVILVMCMVAAIMVQILTGVKGPTFLGWNVSSIITGSMSGTIEIGDMVVVHREKSYDQGDIVMFREDDKLITHRIVGEEKDGFVTKGDANNAIDANPVDEKNIVGVVKLVIPKAGLAADYLRSPLGMTVLAMGVLLLTAIPALKRGQNESSKEKRGAA